MGGEVDFHGARLTGITKESIRREVPADFIFATLAVNVSGVPLGLAAGSGAHGNSGTVAEPFGALGATVVDIAERLPVSVVVDLLALEGLVLALLILCTLVKAFAGVEAVGTATGGAGHLILHLADTLDVTANFLDCHVDLLVSTQSNIY